MANVLDNEVGFKVEKWDFGKGFQANILSNILHKRTADLRVQEAQKSFTELLSTVGPTATEKDIYPYLLSVGMFDYTLAGATACPQGLTDTTYPGTSYTYYELLNGRPMYSGDIFLASYLGIREKYNLFNALKSSAVDYLLATYPSYLLSSSRSAVSKSIPRATTVDITPGDGSTYEILANRNEELFTNVYTYYTLDPTATYLQMVLVAYSNIRVGVDVADNPQYALLKISTKGITNSTMLTVLGIYNAFVDANPTATYKAGEYVPMTTTGTYRVEFLVAGLDSSVKATSASGVNMVREYADVDEFYRYVFKVQYEENRAAFPEETAYFDKFMSASVLESFIQVAGDLAGQQVDPTQPFGFYISPKADIDYSVVFDINESYMYNVIKLLMEYTNIRIANDNYLVSDLFTDILAFDQKVKEVVAEFLNDLVTAVGYVLGPIFTVSLHVATEVLPVVFELATITAVWASGGLGAVAVFAVLNYGVKPVIETFIDISIEERLEKGEITERQATIESSSYKAITSLAIGASIGGIVNDLSLLIPVGMEFIGNLLNIAAIDYRYVLEDWRETGNDSQNKELKINSDAYDDIAAVSSELEEELSVLEQAITVSSTILYDKSNMFYNKYYNGYASNYSIHENLFTSNIENFYGTI